MIEDESDPAIWGDERVEPGERRAVELVVGERVHGQEMRLPIVVWRGEEDGPTVSVTGAVHGDELNGTGAIRGLIVDPPFELRRGTLLLVPVVNLPGFERQSRYMPDRRDLNRAFPGSNHGSQTARFARSFFDQIVTRSDWGIDLHTAALRRTNFPNVRADMNHPELAAFARAFGAELIVSGTGPKGSLRRAATRSGCPTLILEAGEVWKVESTVVEYATRGVRNCLAHLGMIDGEPVAPPYRFETDTTQWVRARHGGFLQFHVAPGSTVSEGEPIATSTSLTGEDEDVVPAPRDGVILGMTTMPAVTPGAPICHLAFPRTGALERVERAQEDLHEAHLHERTREDLATNIHITEASDESD